MIASRLKLIAAALFLSISVGGIISSGQTPANTILGIPAETEVLNSQRTVPPPSATKPHIWKVAFELAFGEDSPYSAEFPNLYALPFNVNLAITKEVLDQIIAVALRETGARQISLSYRAGGYKEFPPVPSAQLEIEATDSAAQDLMNIVGYLAQQTSVIASSRTDKGNRHAIEIVEKSGNALADVKTLQAFWRRLGELSPKLQPGFSSIQVAGRPGLYIIDSDGDWRAKDFPKFKLVIARVSKQFGLKTDFAVFVVEYSELGNNWKLDANGEQYLRRFSSTGQTGLRQRLENEYRLNAHAWIKKAFENDAAKHLRSLSPNDRNWKSEACRTTSRTLKILIADRSAL
ncbi:MAG TPA: hypothetical protein VLL54_07555 [Pyrinomonadaceae bacterium]|nr:hypothetical protein [Pyrinomonadaceae bacterium]